MGTVCIINGYRNAVSETFIQAHIERLQGPVVVLNNYYPEYTYQGRLVRYFYHRHPPLAKLRKLLPHFLYHRWVIQKETSRAASHDFLCGFFRDHKVKVILAEYGFNGAQIYSHARDLGIPLIIHFHGHDAHREPDIEPYLERFREMFIYAFRVARTHPRLFTIPTGPGTTSLRTHRIIAQLYWPSGDSPTSRPRISP